MFLNVMVTSSPCGDSQSSLFHSPDHAKKGHSMSFTFHVYLWESIKGAHPVLAGEHRLLQIDEGIMISYYLPEQHDARKTDKDLDLQCNILCTSSRSQGQ